jgi:hypothetical protein
MFTFLCTSCLEIIVIVFHEQLLPKSDFLLSVKRFIECFLGTRQRSFLSNAKQKTLGKKNTRQRISLPSFFLFLTLDKKLLCRVFFSTLDKDNLKISF